MRLIYACVGGARDFPGIGDESHPLIWQDAVARGTVPPDVLALNRIEVKLENALAARHWPDTLAQVHAALEILRGARGTVPSEPEHGISPAQKRLLAVIDRLAYERVLPGLELLELRRELASISVDFDCERVARGEASEPLDIEKLPPHEQEQTVIDAYKNAGEASESRSVGASEPLRRLLNAVTDCEAVRYALIAHEPGRRPADQDELVEAIVAARAALDGVRAGTPTGELPTREEVTAYYLKLYATTPDALWETVQHFAPRFGAPPTGHPSEETK